MILPSEDSLKDFWVKCAMKVISFTTPSELLTSIYILQQKKKWAHARLVWTWLNLNKKTARGSQDDTKQTIKPSAGEQLLLWYVHAQSNLQPRTIPT